MKISIFGLGYVGAVSLACLARDGHEIIGVDVDRMKLKLIKSGKPPIVENGIVELMQDVVASGRVSVTDDANDAIANSDLTFICVGTPSSSNGSQNLNALSRCSEQIGLALARKSPLSHHTVVVRSTVPPGTVEEVVLPILQERSEKKVGRELSLCFQPEFLREGSSIRDYDNPPMTIVGTYDRKATEPLHNLFGHLNCKFIVTDIRTAETVKYACNAFHALKVTFANEIGRICQAIGSDSHRVMEILCEDNQLNISPAYLRPGFAFGGSCLPKDLKALLYIAKTTDVDLPMLSGIALSNQHHIDHAAATVFERGARRVGVIGLSFKSGTDDLRESPMVTLVEKFLGKGIQVKIYDPEVRVSRLIGANKRYIEEVVPHIGSLMCDSIEETMNGSEAIIVGLSDGAVLAEVGQYSLSGQLVLDLIGSDILRNANGEYRGICW